MVTEENFFDMFNRVHNPDYYYGLKKTQKKKTKKKEAEKKKTRRSDSVKRHSISKV